MTGFDFCQLIPYMTERGGGSMLEELSNSLDYIEENLQEEITIEEIAKAAYTSKFHYQ